MGYVNQVKNVLIKHSPTIMTAAGAVGVVTTAVMAVKATPKAMQILEGMSDEASKFDKAKAVAPVYIPSVSVGVLTITCIFGANSVNLKRNAALASMMAISEKYYNDYKDKVVEAIGEKKEQTVRDEVAKKHIDDKPVSCSEVIMTEYGNTLCYDELSGRYFMSDMEKLRKVQNDINARIIDEVFVSLNEFYYNIGLKPLKNGDEIGWDVERMLDLRFSSQISDDGRPCLVVDYYWNPTLR